MSALRWERATNPESVHALVEASDAAAALRSNTAPLTRNLASTRALLARGHTSVGLEEGVPWATITLGPEPSFDATGISFPRQRPLVISSA
jgi:hypothetical protein